MNKKYIYRFCKNYFENEYFEETESIVTDGVYDFEDWLKDSINGYNNYTVEHEDGSNTYYIIDGCNERTGEMYVVISEEDTDEELRG